MNELNKYQQDAMSFRLPSANNFYAAFGLAEEAGEVCGKIAKAIRDGVSQEVLRDQLKKELGDVLWMVAAVAQDNDLTLAEIAEHNITKLSSRSSRGVLNGSGDER